MKGAHAEEPMFKFFGLTQLQLGFNNGVHVESLHTVTRFQLVFRPLASQLLGQAFRAAGPEAVAATLWPVSNEDAMCTFTTDKRALQSIVQEGN